MAPDGDVDGDALGEGDGEPADDDGEPLGEDAVLTDAEGGGLGDVGGGGVGLATCDVPDVVWCEGRLVCWADVEPWAVEATVGDADGVGEGSREC